MRALLTAVAFLALFHVNSVYAFSCLPGDSLQVAIETNNAACVHDMTIGADLSQHMNVPFDPKRLSQWSTRMTPLAYAARLGKTDVIKVLLENGANINGISYIAHTPITAAAFFGQVETVKYLAKLGADVNIAPVYLTANGLAQVATPISHAISVNEMQTVLALIEVGADVNIESDGMLPLAQATFSLDMVNLLLKSGANPMATNVDDKTALHFCLNQTCAEPLLLAGTPINAKDNSGYTILDYVINVNPPYAAFLRSQGANLGSQLP